MKFLVVPSDALQAGLDIHTFRASDGGSLVDSHFGEEVDLTVTHRYSEHLSASLGLSYVIQGAGLAEIGRLSEDLTWVSAMMSATF